MNKYCLNQYHLSLQKGASGLQTKESIDLSAIAVSSVTIFMLLSDIACIYSFSPPKQPKSLDSRFF